MLYIESLAKNYYLLSLDEFRNTSIKKPATRLQKMTESSPLKQYMWDEKNNSPFSGWKEKHGERNFESYGSMVNSSTIENT